MTKGQTAARGRSFGLRARAWWVMRERNGFTVSSLLSIVANGDEANARSNLGKYLRALAQAGMVEATGRDKPASLTSNGEIRYRLAINAGPKAPVWRHSRNEVFDPNTGAIHPIGAAMEESDHG